jgi:2-methylisocitrate lyase-like PEP mutase family enzyme
MSAMTSNQSAKALAFRDLHRNGTLVLANAWDVASARIVADAGSPAVGTTSAGVAWSRGAADGEDLARDLAVDLIARVSAAVPVPVTADIEGGFAADPDGVAETVRAVLAAGAVGINLEDSHAAGLREPKEQAERIAAARAAADAGEVALFVNARIDTFLRPGDPETRVSRTFERASAYLAAGADGIFVPGATDPEAIRRLCEGIDAPLNIVAGPGAPSVADLRALGVARVSLGSAIAQAAYELVRRAAVEALTEGTYTALTDGYDYGTLNTLMRSGSSTAKGRVPR